MSLTLRKSNRIGVIVGESRTYPFEFGTFPEIVAGATVASAVATSEDTSVTATVASTDTDTANVTIAGVSAGTSRVTVIATLNNGTTKVGIYLDVEAE